MRIYALCRILLLVTFSLGAAAPVTLATQTTESTPGPSSQEGVVLAESVAVTTNSQMILQLPEGSTSSTLRFNLLVTNTSSTVYEVGDLQPEIEVYDRASMAWPIDELVIQYETVSISQNVTFRIELTVMNPNVLEYNGPVFVRVHNLLDNDLTVFGLAFQNGDTTVPTQALANPLNEAQKAINFPGQFQAQVHPVHQQSAEPLSGSPMQSAAPAIVGPLNVDAMLPTVNELPTGLWIVNQGKLTQSAIASTFTDPNMAERFLNDWGWQENAHVYLEGAPTVDGITYVDVGLHRFSSETSALLAMDYYVDGRAEVMEMWEIDDFEYGGNGRTITNGTDTTAYVVVDSVVVRVSVAGTDPSPHTLQIRQLVVDKAYAQSSSGTSLWIPHLTIEEIHSSRRPV